ncbi:hypothetical protein EVAR_95576_1 [Eumeta japonica]|uniref:Uncharacterized protein n=1 Tax=Eumeta variegata TaxID=151549 RepID=A0A4C1ZTZ7_EUMVA|nr:hypothetical protein EVAR_95576_1 [Eumeta japonica]
MFVVGAGVVELLFVGLDKEHDSTTSRLKPSHICFDINHTTSQCRNEDDWSFLRSGRSGDPPLPETAVTVEDDVGVPTNNSSSSPAGSGVFQVWTLEMGPSPLDRRDHIPDKKTPGHEANVVYGHTFPFKIYATHMCRRMLHL